MGQDFQFFSRGLSPRSNDLDTNQGDVDPCKVWMSGPSSELFQEEIKNNPNLYCQAQPGDHYLFNQISNTSWTAPKNPLDTIQTIVKESKARKEILKTNAASLSSSSPNQFKEITVRLPSFDTTNNHQVVLTFHIPNTPAPEGGYKLVPYFLGSAFRFEDMLETPQRIEMANALSQAEEPMVLVAISYCVLDQIKESFEINPSQTINNTSYINTQLVPDGVTMHETNPLLHMFKEGSIAMNALRDPELVNQYEELSGLEFDTDIKAILGTSSGGILAYTAARWTDTPPEALILYNAVTSARFHPLLAGTVIGQHDMQYVENGILSTPSYDTFELSTEIVNFRASDDGLIDFLDHSSSLYLDYTNKDLNPSDHLTHVYIEGDGGHNMTNLAGSSELHTMTYLTVKALESIYTEEEDTILATTTD